MNGVAPDVAFGVPAATDLDAEVVIIGAGACGLTAALRAQAAGAEVLVLERDASPAGSTSMSSGFVPAPGTRAQKAAGVTDDDAARFLADIMAKSHGNSDAELARLAAATIGPALDWLELRAGVAWTVLTDFLYPGHSRHRMHAVDERTGAALEARLLAATAAAGIPVVTRALARTLHVDADGAVRAVTVLRPGGGVETVGCRALVLACNGYGGNPALVAEHIPEIAGGQYYGHAGNTGSAVLWGRALGAALRHLSGYQGHGSLAHPHGILISWALMAEGAIQVNRDGRRFGDESGGYSEAAVRVLAQPGGIAWNLYDAQRHDFAMRGFPDYRQAVEAGAVVEAADAATLAGALQLPAGALADTLDEVEAARAGGPDRFGRSFAGTRPFLPPFRAVRVTGALFHTQGGLAIGPDARVLRTDGRAFPNLFAAGGAACGVSGPSGDGYLSGNGLLTAIGFGWIAGDAATRV
jgi:fumarate reductase flavoprotein subunit